jgi:hypothetical protein
MNMTQVFEAAVSWIQLVQAGFTHKGADAVALEPAIRSFWLMHGIERTTPNQSRF